MGIKRSVYRGLGLFWLLSLSLLCLSFPAEAPPAWAQAWWHALNLSFFIGAGGSDGSAFLPITVVRQGYSMSGMENGVGWAGVGGELSRPPSFFSLSYHLLLV